MRLIYRTGPMESLRKWFYKPKRDDRSLLAQFFFADDALNMIAAELDSFDGRKDPDRCSTLVNQLRHAQDRVLNITSQIIDQLLGDERVARGFRVKFPEDVLQDNLAGQLWFGAECLSAGSSIMNREEESAAMRPLAKALTRSLETVRFLLRERCLRPRGLALSQQIVADDMLQESLKIFDRLFAEFELCYVSAMVNVKTPHEFEAQQLICVLFSESLRRALKQNLLTQEQVDSYDPALMFAVPRLAIVSGLLIYSSGPLSIDKPPEEMSDMFRPFRTLLHKIRSLLWTLDRRELSALERLLATNGDVASFASVELPPASEIIDDPACPYPDIGEFVSRFYADHANVRDLYTPQTSSEPTITDADYLPDNIEVMTPILDGLRRLTEVAEETETEPDSDTFQDRSRKTSKTEDNKSDLSSLRNLSTNGLMMFDPLVINAMTASTSDTNRQFPDYDLVTSLNEQVTEINDRLSSIAGSDVDIIDSMHSFSTNDVPTLISTEDSEAFGFASPRNEQISCMPSTSHGYLIPNAISHEPAVLSSLSQNNSTIFNPEDESENAMTNSAMIMPDHPIDTDITTNITLSIANANLSSLLLTNEEYRENFESHDDDNTSFHSAKMTIENHDEDKVKFMLGYESDHESPVDSGVSTENTSLDRSPDVEKENLIENRVQETTSDIQSVSRRIEENTRRFEASSSLEQTNISSDEDEPPPLSPKSKAEANRKLKEEARKVLNDWGMPMPENEEFKTIDDVIAELRKQRREKKTSVETQSSSQSSSRKKDARRKSTSKNKRKRSKMFMVILESQNTQNQNAVRLNLDHFVDDSVGTLDITECADDEQIALALQAQELAARQQARGKFKSSEDLIHRLFVCIAGVADQLQTNFAADLRNILKSVFLMNQTPDEPEPTEKPPTIEYEVTEDQVIQNGSSFDSVYSAEEVYADSNSDSIQSETGSRLVRRNTVNSATLNEQPTSAEVRTEVRRKSVDNGAHLQASVSTGDLTLTREESRESRGVERAPEWVPDIAAPACMRCSAHFTAFRRRHHCRNCGKVFCASCSSNSCPLPRYGQLKPVRVCEECFRSIADTCRRQR